MGGRHARTGHRATSPAADARPQAPPHPPLTIFSLLFLLTLLLPQLANATPAPPPTLVSQHEANSGFCCANVVSILDNLTWRLSPDDPDQTNGTLYYSAWVNVTGITGWVNDSAVGAYWHPIPNRPGWVYATRAYQWTVTNNDYAYNWNITASDSTQSVAACNTRIQANDNNAHDQCGNTTIQAPPGISGFINNSLRTLDFRFPITPDDPHSGSLYGDYSYRLNITINYQNGAPYQIYNVSAPGGNLTLIPSTNAVRISRTDYANYSGLFAFNNVGASLTAFGMAKDAAGTHQWSAPSCSITIQPYPGNITETCGNATDISYAFHHDLPPQSQQFPGVDIAATSTSLGISTDSLGYILGTIILLAATGGAYYFGRTPGAAIAGSLSLGVVGIMGLYPLWLIVIIFLAAVGIITLTLSRGGSQ